LLKLEKKLRAAIEIDRQRKEEEKNNAQSETRSIADD